MYNMERVHWRSTCKNVVAEQVIAGPPFSRFILISGMFLLLLFFFFFSSCCRVLCLSGCVYVFIFVSCLCFLVCVFVFLCIVCCIFCLLCASLSLTSFGFGVTSSWFLLVFVLCFSVFLISLCIRLCVAVYSLFSSNLDCVFVLLQLLCRFCWSHLSARGVLELHF